MDDEILNGFFRVFHMKTESIAFEITRIPRLPPRLSVKRRRIQDDFRLFAGRRRFDGLAVHENGRDFRFVLRRGFVTAENAGHAGARRLEVAFRHGFLAAPLPCAAGAFALALHLGFKAFRVQGDPVFFNDVRRKVGGEAEGIVQLENHLAGQDGLSRFFERFRLFLQNAQARVERFHEALLFV